MVKVRKSCDQGCRKISSNLFWPFFLIGVKEKMSHLAEVAIFFILKVDQNFFGKTTLVDPILQMICYFCTIHVYLIQTRWYDFEKDCCKITGNQMWTKKVIAYYLYFLFLSLWRKHFSFISCIPFLCKPRSISICFSLVFQIIPW